MNTRDWLIALVGLVLCPFSAKAQVPSQVPQQPQVESTTIYSGDTYVAARIGVIIPKSDDLDGFDNGLALEATLGRRVNPNIALELSVGRYAMDASASSGGQSASAEVSAIPITGTMKVIAPFEKVDMYGLVGAGVYFISSKLSASGYYSGDATDDGASLGLTLGGGLAAHLTRQFTLGAEVKYLLGEVKLFDQDVNYDSLIVGGMANISF